MCCKSAFRNIQLAPDGDTDTFNSNLLIDRDKYIRFSRKLTGQPTSTIYVLDITEVLLLTPKLLETPNRIESAVAGLRPKMPNNYCSNVTARPGPWKHHRKNPEHFAQVPFNCLHLTRQWKIQEETERKEDSGEEGSTSAPESSIAFCNLRSTIWLQTSILATDTQPEWKGKKREKKEKEKGKKKERE